MYFRRLGEPGEESAQASEISLGHSLADDSQLLVVERAKGHVERQGVLIRQRDQFLQFVSVGRRVPRRDCSVANRFIQIGNDQIHVDIDHVAEPLATPGKRPADY